MLQQRYPNRFSQSPHMSHLEKNCFISASVSSDLKALYKSVIIIIFFALGSKNNNNDYYS